jgi:Arc/MetJ-type ribon-helix-helix transcriptional regulator
MYDHTQSMKMAIIERVTVSLPNDLIREIDRREKNRSKFIAEAVRRELDSRRQAELRRSLQNPHPESVELAEQELDEWTRSLPEEDTGALLDGKAGKPVRWVPGEGWLELDPLESDEENRR